MGNPKDLSFVGEATRRLNPEVFNLARVPAPACELDYATLISPKLRQNRGPKTNKTEAAFESWLRAKYPGVQIEREGITFLLANGLRYTPDYAAFNPDRSLVLYEVKGAPGAKVWDDSIAKLKMAASKFPTIEFWLVNPKDRTKTDWRIERVYP